MNISFEIVFYYFNAIFVFQQHSYLKVQLICWIFRTREDQLLSRNKNITLKHLQHVQLKSYLIQTEDEVTTFSSSQRLFSLYATLFWSQSVYLGVYFCGLEEMIGNNKWQKRRKLACNKLPLIGYRFSFSRMYSCNYKRIGK